MVLGLIVYLIGLARWGKLLREESATIERRRLYGLAAGSVPVVFGLISLTQFHSTQKSAVALQLGWSFLLGFLCYLTVVHSPKWIVGKYGQSETERRMQETRQYAKKQ